MISFRTLNFLKYDNDQFDNLFRKSTIDAIEELKRLDDIDLSIAFVYEASKGRSYCEPLELINIVEGWGLGLSGWADKKIEIKQYAIEQFNKKLEYKKEHIYDEIKEYKSNKIKYHNIISNLEKEINEYKK